jgi:hypothetical protein
MLALTLLLACDPHTIKLGADTGVPTDDTGVTDTSGNDTASTDSAADTGATDTSGNDTGSSDSATDTGIPDTGADDTSTDTGATDTGTPPPACRAAAAIVGETLTLAYGSTTDGYTGGAWGSTSTTSDATVALNAESSCAANVAGTLSGTLATLGDPATVLCLGWGGAVSHTERLTAPATAPATPVAIPPPSEGEVTVAYGATRHVSVDTRFDRLRLEGTSRLVVDAPLAIHVDGELSSAGTIELAPGATLDLHVTGSLRLEWGSTLNPGGDAAAVRVHVLDGENVVLAYGSSAVMRLEAPESAVTLEGATLAGTVTARTLGANWGTALHLDGSGVCAR